MNAYLKIQNLKKITEIYLNDDLQSDLKNEKISYEELMESLKDVFTEMCDCKIKLIPHNNNYRYIDVCKIAIKKYKMCNILSI